MAAPHSIKFFATPHRSRIGLFLIPFSLRQTLSLLLSLVAPCRDLSQRTAQHKLHATTPTSASHIATVPPHCSVSATMLRATHGPVAHDKTRPPCDDAKIGTHTQRRVVKVAMQHFGRRSATPTRTKCIIHISHEVRHFGLVLLQAPKSPIPQSEISEISGCGAWVWWRHGSHAFLRAY